MKLLPIAVLLAATAACSGSASSSGTRCSDLWIEGANISAANPCLSDNGQEMTFVSASLSCPDESDRVNINMFGWWLDSDQILRAQPGDWPNMDEACS